MIYDPNLSFSVQRLRDLGRALEGAMELDLPRVLEALEQARKGTPEALHEEAATYAARAKKAEDQLLEAKRELRETRAKLSAADADHRLFARALVLVAGHLEIDAQALLEDASLARTVRQERDLWKSKADRLEAVLEQIERDSRDQGLTVAPPEVTP